MVDPDGRRVAFTARTWRHIQSVRPELLNQLDAIISTVSQPDVRESDPRPGRERFYRRHVTDQIRWMCGRRLQQDSCGRGDRIHPAKESNQQLMIKIAGIEFDHHSYDDEADVLYLSVGQPQVPAETDPTPEGHAVDFDADGNVIGMIIINLRFLLERDGELKITWPEAHVPREEFSAVLPAAA